MITAEKIDIFFSYGGSEDGFEIHRDDSATQVISASDWGQIKSLVQDVYLIDNSFTSDMYKLEFESKLKSECDNEQTITLLKKMARSRKCF